MSKKMFLLLSCVLWAALVSQASALDFVWEVTSGNGLWTDANNWTQSLTPKYAPDSAYGDKAKICALPGPTISAGMAASCSFLAIGDNASGTVHMTGGTLSVALPPPPIPQDSWTILAYGASDNGTLTIDGGVMTTTSRMFVGFQGTGTLNMNGGTVTVGGLFGVGYCDGGATTGKGYVYLNGGTINATNGLQMRNPAGCYGQIDLRGGTLTVNGDQTGTGTIVRGYVDNGWITGYGRPQSVAMTYDVGTNKTTLVGVIDTSHASSPSPANNAVNVAPYVVLNWAQSPGAVTQDIYFGADSNAVSNATPSTSGIYQTSVPHDVNTFAPVGLALDTTYYWRIDGVNDVNVVKGNVWKFTTATYSLVDDFEKYADTAGMLAVWSNGGTTATLSLATTGGHDNPKALQFAYNNAGSPFYSEGQTIGINSNWTIAGVLALDIWYKGSAGNAAEPMYAALKDKNSSTVVVIVNSDQNAAKAADWQVWHIALSEFAGVDLANVEKLIIGFGDRANPVTGGAGTVYFDDVRLYPTRCLIPPATDLNGDCVVDFKDFAIFARNWMGQ